MNFVSGPTSAKMGRATATPSIIGSATLALEIAAACPTRPLSWVGVELEPDQEHVEDQPEVGHHPDQRDDVLREHQRLEVGRAAARTGSVPAGSRPPPRPSPAAGRASPPASPIRRATSITIATAMKKAASVAAELALLGGGHALGALPGPVQDQTQLAVGGLAGQRPAAGPRLHSARPAILPSRVADLARLLLAGVELQCRPVALQLDLPAQAGRLRRPACTRPRCRPACGASVSRGRARRARAWPRSGSPPSVPVISSSPARASSGWVPPRTQETSPVSRSPSSRSLPPRV